MFDTNGIGKGLMDVVGATFGLALIALIISRSGEVGNLLSASTQSVTSLIKTATNPNSF